MKKLGIILLGLMMSLTSCTGMLEISSDPIDNGIVYYDTYSDYYIDNSRGILVVYIDNLPYWQYYNPYNRMWYRSLVPYEYRHNIILNRYRGRSFWDYKFYQDRRHWRPQPNMMRPRPNFDRRPNNNNRFQPRPNAGNNRRPQGNFGGHRNGFNGHQRPNNHK